MKKKEMVDLTNEIVTRYYDNDIQPFLDHVDEKALWYGPAKGQFLCGRQAILNAWSNENHSLSFSLGNVRLDHISTHDSYCEVMMSVPVTTHYPDGNSITMNQIVHITWCERTIANSSKKVPRMLVIHISDLYHKHEADNIYPTHFTEIYKGHLPVVDTGTRLHFSGMNSSDLYLLSDSIVWVESITYGRHSILHTTEGDYPVSASTSTLLEEHPDFLMRCHKCFLINPKHIISIDRFNVTLINNTKLPIPEKKYTAFKKAVYDRFSKESNC